MPIIKRITCVDFKVNEEVLERFRKHFRQTVPAAVFMAPGSPAQEGGEHGNERVLSEQEADDIFTDAFCGLQFQGFALIKGEAYEPHENGPAPFLSHCYIIYAMPLEGADEYYDGRIEFRGHKAEHGYSPAEAEARLRILADSFGREFNLQPVLFVNRQGSAERIFLKSAEAVYACEGGDRSAVVEYGVKEAISGVQLLPADGGVLIKTGDKSLLCRFRYIQNKIINAGNSKSNLGGVLCGSNLYAEKFAKDPRRYFSWT